MRFATRRDGTRDGTLLLVSRDHRRAARAGVPTLQALLDDWTRLYSAVSARAKALDEGGLEDDFPFEFRDLESPLPRAFGWLDASAYLNHVRLVRRARGAEPPPTLLTDPLMYQGGSDAFLGPFDPIPMVDEAHGVDFEGEIAVVVDDVPLGASVAEAAAAIRLVLLVNDVSLRHLIPAELAKGFGFLVSKPSSAFSPLALTPDELGDHWRDGRLHLPLQVTLNGARFGDPEAGPEMHFSFPELIAHAAKTRRLTAGTIVGSGTVSNADRARGSACLAERRMLEQIDEGAPKTPFLKDGDRVRLEVIHAGQSLFGPIDQRVERR